MSLKQRMVERSSKALSRPMIMRWVTDDRVLKAAEGVMDARMRVRDAWHVLKNGHQLPNVDPALNDYEGNTAAPQPGNGRSARAGCCVRR